MLLRKSLLALAALFGRGDEGNVLWAGVLGFLMQGGAAVLACPWKSWSCSAEYRRTGLFCFSVRDPPPPKGKSRLQPHCFSYRLVNSVALLAGNGLSSNLSPAVCPVTSVPFRIPICIVRNGQAPVCRRPGCRPPSGAGLSLAPHEVLAAPSPPSAQSLQAALPCCCPLLSSS